MPSLSQVRLPQVGLAVGVAVLIAVLGSPRSLAATLAAYQRGSVVIAAIAFGGGIVGLVLLTSSRRRSEQATVPSVSSVPTAGEIL